MSQIIEVLDFLEIRTPEDARETVGILSTEAISKLNTSILEATEYDLSHLPRPREISSRFRFVASSSVRAELGCGAISCQLRKLQSLMRFAALYADEVFIPLPGVRSRGCEHGHRRALLHDLMLLTELRPVIEAGIVRPYVPALCRRCSEKKASDLGLLEAAELLAAEYSDKFEIHALGGTETAVDVRIVGPEDFLEGGSITCHLHHVPEWYPSEYKRRLRKAEPLPSSAGIKQHLRYLFTSVARDALYQMLCSKIAGASLTHLVGRQGEVEYLDLLHTKPTHSDILNVNAARLVHHIPLLECVPISKVIKLRNSYRDAFVLYRGAIDKIVEDHLQGGGELSESAAREIRADVLEPRLAKLRIEAAVYTRAQRNRTIVKAGSVGALLALGIVGGVLPAGWSDLFRAIGAFSVARDIIETAAESGQATAVQTNELYFLLRAQGIH